MGVGNYCLSSDECGKVLYVDYMRGHEESEDTPYIESSEWLWENLMEEIQDCHTKRLTKPLKEQFVSDRLVLLESDLVLVSIIDWQSYAAVCVQVHPDIETPYDDDKAKLRGIAYRNMEQTAKRIFNYLHSLYGENCAVRSSAWTSSPFEPIK